MYQKVILPPTKKAASKRPHLLLRVYMLDGTHVRVRVANGHHLPVHAALSALSTALGIGGEQLSECGIFACFVDASGRLTTMRLLASSAKLRPLPPGGRFVLRRRRRVPSGPLESSSTIGIHHPNQHISPPPSHYY